MEQSIERTKTREAVALFKDEATLQSAIDELLSSGFDRAELSLLATEDTLRATFGDRFKSADELEDVSEVPRSCYVSPEAIGDAKGGIIGGLVYIGAVAATGLIVLSGGTLAATIAAAVIAGGASGLVGTFFAEVVEEVHSTHIKQHLEQGGLLLWVRTWTPDDEQRAIAILGRHSGEDVHIHGERAA